MLAIAVLAGAAAPRAAYVNTLHDAAARAATDDSASVHRALRKRIERFQDAWRKQWEAAQFGQHGWLDVAGIGRDNDAESARVRRFWTLSCYRMTPQTVPIQPPSPVVRRPVVARPDHGSICPIWSPPGAGIPPNEGEAIDLALPDSVRGRVRVARDSLIHDLELALAKYPDDAWIAGQRVRFVLDQRVPERTVAAAQGCHGDQPTCLALMGLALRQARNVAAAGLSFAAADSVAALSRERKGPCIDDDVLLLFAAPDRERIRETSCEEQQGLVQRLWWLADPLWSAPGNERYVEHEARRTHVALRAVNDRDERYVWEAGGGGASLRQTVIRYGWPDYTYWPGWQYEQSAAHATEAIPPLVHRPAPTIAGSGSTRIRMRAPGAMAPPTTRIVDFPYTVKEYSPDRTALLPALTAIIDPFSLRAADQQLQNPDLQHLDEWWPQEHMMLLTHLAPLASGQDAQWRRDSTITYQLAIDDPLRVIDTTATGASLALLMGGTSPATTRELARSATAEGLTLRLRATLTAAPIVLSAEVLPRTTREEALRLRFGLRPPPVLRDMQPADVALSDPVFMRMPNRTMPVPADEPSVLRYMAGGLSFPATEPLALYWESYGFRPGDSVQVEVKIRRNDELNVARRVGARLGVASALRDSISIRWTEPDTRHSTAIVPGRIPVVARVVALDVSALAPGAYVVIIEMRKSPTVSARGERQFVVTKPS